MAKLIILELFIYFGLKVLKVNKGRNLETLALSLLISLGYLGFIPFVLNEYINISYPTSINYMVITSILFFLITLLLKQPKVINKFVLPRHLHVSFSQCLLFISFVLLIARGIIMPLRGWDAVSLYDSRAKMFLSGLKLSEMKYLSDYDDKNSKYYFSYPPMTSAIHTVFYSQNVENVMIIYAIFYICLAIFLYIFLRERNIDKYLKVGLFLAVMLNPEMLSLTSVAHTNLPCLAFQFAALFYLLRYLKEKSSEYFIISAILLGFSIWTRSLEPIYVGFLIGAVYIIFRQQRKRLLNKVILLSIYFLLSVGVRYFWSYFLKSSVGFTGESLPTLSLIINRFTDSILLSNLIDVTLFIYIAFDRLKYYLIFYFGMLVIFIIKDKKRMLKPSSILVSIVILSMFVVMVLGTIYFSVTRDFWDKISDSFFRSCLLFILLFISSIALMLDKSERSKYEIE